MSAPAAVPQFLGAWLCRRTELLRTVGASLTRAGLFLPLRVVHPGTSLHPPGGEPNGPLDAILSPRRIVGGRSPHSSDRRPRSLTLRPLRYRGRIRLLGPGWCQARDGAAWATSVAPARPRGARAAAP